MTARDNVGGSTTAVPQAPREPSPLIVWVRVFCQNHLAVVALVVLVAIVLFCYLGPLFYRTDQIHADLNAVNLVPGSPGHPLGTNQDGVDQLGRLMVGAQITLLVGVVAAILATIVGTLWGAIAGYLGGVVDSIMMRIVDSALSIPSVFLLVLLAAIVPPSIVSLILTIALISWLATARLVRAEALTLRTRDFVAASRVMGGRSIWTIRRHIAPNTFGVVLVNATFQIADAILILAALGYLGLGLPQPLTDLGAMLSQGLQYVYGDAWWLIWPPGVLIVVIVAATNFIGDGMRDAFDIRVQRR